MLVWIGVASVLPTAPVRVIAPNWPPLNCGGLEKITDAPCDVISDCVSLKVNEALPEVACTVLVRYGTAALLKLLKMINCTGMLAMPFESVTLVGLPTVIWPLVTAQFTVAPDTGFPLVSVAF